MGNKQINGVVNVEDVRSLYSAGVASQQDNNDRQAVSYYTQALNRIKLIDNTSEEVGQLEYNIILSIYRAQIRLYKTREAKAAINKALEMVNKLQIKCKIAECLDCRGSLKIMEGDIDGASDDFIKSMEIKKNLDGNEEIDLSQSYVNIGQVYSQQGKYDDAICMFEKALKIQLSQLGDNHPSITETYDSMGHHYDHQGKHDNAISMHERSLKIRLLVLGNNHPLIAFTYNNLGITYCHQGKYENALSMLQKSLQIRLSIYGHDHPATAESYNNIGGLYNDQKNYHDALSMYQKSLKIYLPLLDSNHPTIAYLYHNIGSIYSQQGNYNEAIDMYNTSLDIKLSVLGDNHQDVATTYHSLGNVYSRQDKYDEAILMYEKSLHINLLILGNHHPMIARTYQNMGIVYHYQGNLDRAISVYQKSLQIYLLTTAENHPSIANLYHNMGNIYLDQCNYDDAIYIYEKSLKIKLYVLGEDNPTVADTYNMLGRVYQCQAKYDKAISFCEKSLKIRLSTLANNHPTLASSYDSIGDIYQHQTKYADAISMHEKSLKIISSAFGDKHPRVAQTYQTIGILYYKQNKYDDALSMYHKSLQILSSGLGDHHLKIADVYYDIGNVYIHQDKYDDAVSIFHKAANILIRFCGENQPKLALIYSNIAYCYDLQNRPHEASAMRQRSNHISQSLQQFDTTNQQSSANHFNPSKVPQDDATSVLPDQDRQIKSQQISNTSDIGDNSQIEDNIDQVLKEKRYFKAYVQALKHGSCKNTLIRAMYTGPQYVGKSSIMRVFTQQRLIHALFPTQVVDESDKMVHLKVYKIKDRSIYDIDKVWQNNVMLIVELQMKNQVHQQQMATLAYEQAILSHISIDDQNHMDVPVKMATINTETTLKPSSTPTSQANDELFLQRCRDFFQYYYPSWLNKTADDSQYAKIWDFGGHSIYHVTHQPFLSSNSIYILVFNINQNIHDKVLTRNDQSLNITYLQAMQEWLTSIIGGNGSQSKITADIDHDQVTYSLPIVILVASHGDCIANEEEGNKRFIQFEREMLSSMPCYKSNIYSSRIIFNCNPNDNSHCTLVQREKCSLHLHEIMKSFVHSLPFMRHPIPIRWYIMATLLHTPITNHHSKNTTSIMKEIRATRVHKIMTIQETITLAQDLGLYDGKDQMTAMLSYLHDLGEIIFCRKAGQHGIIVTNVDWLLQLFRAIIQLQDCPSGSLEIQSLYQMASQSGRISRQYIDYVLLRYNVDEKTKTNIISIMETYDIICTITSDNNQDEGQYFVPYLLRTDVKPFDLSKYHVSHALYIGYNHNDIPYIPDGIYYCLLSSCLKEWNNTDVELYYQCAKYYLRQECHYMIVKKEKSYIALQYCYKKESQPQVAKLLMDKVINSIYNKSPHQLIQSKLASIVDDRMPKFKGATCQFYAPCCDCNQLVNLCNKVQSPGNNMLQCLSCYTIFESQSINDWMVYNEDCWRKRESQECIKQQAHNDIKDQDPRRYFYQIANLIGNDWTKLAAALASHVDIDVIRSEDRYSIFDQAIKFLKTWYQENCPYASMDRLHTVLKEIGRNDIIMAINDS